MKWFKHYSNAKHSESLANLEEELGLEGYARYWKLLELLAEKFDGENTKFKIPSRVIRQCIRVKGAIKLRQFLDTLAIHCGYIINETENIIEIDAPILLDLQSKDFKYNRKKLAQVSPKNKDKDKDKDLDKELSSSGVKPAAPKKPKSSKAPNPQIELNREVWEKYSSEFFERYQSEPVRNAKVNSAISNLGKRLGRDAIDVVGFYVWHDDNFYKSKTHSIEYCLKDAESLHLQWKKGHALTKQDIYNNRKQSNTANLLKKINEGKL